MLDDFLNQLFKYCALSAYLFVMLSFCRFFYSCLKPLRRPAVYYQQNLMALRNNGIDDINYHQHVNQRMGDVQSGKDEGAEENDEYLMSTTGKFDEGQCSICLRIPQVDVAFPPCGHTFCFECIFQWCKIKNECPICKQEIFFLYHYDEGVRFDWMGNQIIGPRIIKERLEDIFLRKHIIDIAIKRDKLMAHQWLWSSEWLENMKKIWDLDFQIDIFLRSYTTGKSTQQLITEYENSSFLAQLFYLSYD